MPPPSTNGLPRQQLLALGDVVFSSENFSSKRLRLAGITSAAMLVERWQEVPFITKADLVADSDAYPPFGTVMTAPLARYHRFCQTSGTSTGQPLAWLDTPESWDVLLGCWSKVFQAAGLLPGVDRVFFAFSFGPFLGFWTAFEAAAKDYVALPGGGMSSEARFAAIQRYGATVLCCTPTYALRLGELAEGQAHGIKKIIVAGEPGGSVPAVRGKIEALWRARVLDHHGMTEVGPVTFEREERPGFVEVMEHAYFPEVIDPSTGQPVADGDCGELVLTTLARTACPLIRYRTGDWVRGRRVGDAFCLEGGVLGRCDEMLLIRGVNVYPSAVDNIVRSFPGIAEYLVLRKTVDAMEELEIRVELAADADDGLARQLERRLKDAFTLRIPVTVVAPSTLPRHEFKARRWVSAPAC